MTPIVTLRVPNSLICCRKISPISFALTGFILGGDRLFENLSDIAGGCIGNAKLCGFVGNKFAAKIPMKLVHTIAAAIFAVMGVLTLLQVEKLFQ